MKNPRPSSMEFGQCFKTDITDYIPVAMPTFSETLS